MNINLILLKLLLSKELFTKYSTIIDLDYFKTNHKVLFKVFLALFKAHEADEDVTPESLTLTLYTMYPNLRDDERHLIDDAIQKITNLEIDEAQALEYLNTHLEQTIATQIAIKGLEISQGKGSLGTIRELLDKAVITEPESTQESFVTTDLELLVNETVLTEGLRWRLNTMNKMMGSLRKGNFGFIFARPETGKTTFLASEVMFMAEQAKERGLGPVLWLNNEEDGSKVMLRCYQALFGIDKQELYTNLQHYKDEFERRVGGHFLFYDDAAINKKTVEKLCKQHKPSLIIFDQIDKVVWYDSERYDLKMKAIYQWARELAKTYCPVIGVCQAGGTAEGKKYLNMNDVDSSHTAKQGEADFMIGIGKTNSDSEEFVRFLSLAKNKLDGDVDSDPDLRHGKMPIIIHPNIARYADSIEWK